MTISADGIVTHPSGRIIVSLHEVDVRPLIGTSWRSRGEDMEATKRISQDKRLYIINIEETSCREKKRKSASVKPQNYIS